MNAHRPYDPQRDGPLLSGYADGELDAADRALVESWLETDHRAREELARLVRLKAFTDHLALREAPAEAWDEFRERAMPSRERGLAWLLLWLGVALVGGFVLLRLGAVLLAASLPIVLRLGLLLAAAGLVLLLVSALRERFFVRKRDRYDDITR